MQHKKILHCDDERGFGNGWFVYTAYGWAFDPDADENAACHVRSFDTIKQLRAELKFIEPCQCGRCTQKGQ